MWKPMFLAVLIVSCSSSESNPSSLGPGECGSGVEWNFPDVPPMDEATFMSTYVKEYCDIVQSCCGATQLAFDRPKCEENAEKRFDVLKTGTAIFDPAGGAKCIGAVRVFASECPTRGVTVVLPASFECRDAYHGTKAPGETCVPGDCAIPPNGSALCLNQKCEVILDDIQPGESCVGLGTANESHLCVEGHDCSLETKRCEKTCDVPVAGACGPDRFCAGPTFCDPSTQKCRPLLLVGESCSGYEECTSLSCENGKCVVGVEAESCLGLD